MKSAGRINSVYCCQFALFFFFLFFNVFVGCAAVGYSRHRCNAADPHWCVRQSDSTLCNVQPRESGVCNFLLRRLLCTPCPLFKKNHSSSPENKKILFMFVQKSKTHPVCIAGRPRGWLTRWSDWLLLLRLKALIKSPGAKSDKQPQQNGPRRCEPWQEETHSFPQMGVKTWPPIKSPPPPHTHGEWTSEKERFQYSGSTAGSCTCPKDKLCQATC